MKPYAPMLSELVIGTRFRKTYEDEGHPPYTISGKLVYKNACRALVLLDGTPHVVKITDTAKGRVKEIHVSGRREESWPLEVEVEVA